jgi:hypothetical protein
MPFNCRQSIKVQYLKNPEDINLVWSGLFYYKHISNLSLKSSAIWLELIEAQITLEFIVLRNQDWKLDNLAKIFY